MPEDVTVKLVELLRWPTVALIVCVLALLLFRLPFSSLLGRLRRVKIPWVEAVTDDAAQEQVQAQAAAKESKSPVREALPTQRNSDAAKAFIPQIVTERVAVILNDPDVAGIADPFDRAQVLARALAAVQYALLFERAYQLIFRSQIHALRACSSTAVPVSELQRIYSSAVPPLNNPNHSYAFENWVGFLVNWAQFLIVANGEARITDVGREFLKYLIDMRYGDKMN